MSQPEKTTVKTYSYVPFADLLNKHLWFSIETCESELRQKIQSCCDAFARYDKTMSFSDLYLMISDSLDRNRTFTSMMNDSLFDKTDEVVLTQVPIFVTDKKFNSMFRVNIV